MYENYLRELDEIEQKIIRLGIAMGIDWQDHNSVVLLATEALDWHKANTPLQVDMLDEQQRTKTELFGMMQLMLAVQEEAAIAGVNVTPGEVGKKINKALHAANKNVEN